MKKWLRRIRGAIGMGLIWALAWFGAGMALLLVVGFGAADVPFPLGFGMLGFFAGVTFSVVLVLGEGRRRFDQMSLPRFAGWGAGGGLLLSVLFVLAVAVAEDMTFIANLVFLGPIFAVAGAGSAAGTLALARMAEEREVLEGSADVAEVGRSGDEAQELLGGTREPDGNLPSGSLGLTSSCASTALSARPCRGPRDLPLDRSLPKS